MAVDWDALVIGPLTGVFGEPATYTTPGQTFPITGVFDEAYLALTPLGSGFPGAEGISMGSPGDITTEMPVLGVQLSQFPDAPAQGDLVCVRGTNYAVKEVRPDGHGHAKLMLSLFSS